MAESIHANENVVDLSKYGNNPSRAPATLSKPFSDKPLQSGGGGGTMDDMSERIIRLEERTDLFGRQLDRIVTRLDSMDAKLSSLPTKEFLVTSLLSSVGVMLAIAIAFGLGTFAIADYAAKKAAPATPAATPSPAPQQPLVIVVPSLSAVPHAVTPPLSAPVPVAPAPPSP